jgi:hypothetical protein
MGRQKQFTEEELKARRSAYRRAYWENLKKNNPEKYQKYIENGKAWANKNRKQLAERQKEIRRDEKYGWGEYFKNYFKEWLKNDENWFTHRCRCYARIKLKDTKEYQTARSQGKTIEHILTLTNLASYFKWRGLLDRSDKKMISLLISIANMGINLKYIKKEKNNKGNNSPIEQQLKVAEQFEKKYPLVCGGLFDFLKGETNE